MCGSAAAAGRGEGGGEGLRLGDKTVQALLGKRKKIHVCFRFSCKERHQIQVMEKGGGGAKSDRDDISSQADEFVCFAAFQILWAPSPVSRSCFHPTLLLNSPAALVLLCPFCLANSLCSARQLFFFLVSNASPAIFLLRLIFSSIVSLFFLQDDREEGDKTLLIARLKCWQDASSARL